jgi:hypothetical protein
MSKKSARPALYELLRQRVSDRAGNGAAEPPPRREPPPRDESGGPSMLSKLMSPGSVVRLPVGYLLLATTAILVVVLVVYIAGHARGVKSARANYEDEMRAKFDVDRVGAAVVDPTGQPPSGRGANSQGQPNRSSPPLAKFDASRAGPVESDPRLKGMSYYILATYPRESAVKLAEFCRSQGLEAYVITGNNARSRRVIALPLFRYADRATERIRQLDAMIIDVGQKWHLSDPKNNDNLGGHYIDTMN